jgi:hypothetical protein
MNQEPGTDKFRKTTYYRTTDFSAPSEVISLPTPQRLYVGPAAKSTFVTHKDGAQLHRDWFETKIAAVVWDEQWAADVSIDKEVFIGGVLNHQGDTEVVHPLNLEFKIVEDYDFRGDTIIADIRGGEAVGGERGEPLYSPTECAAVDAQGNLVVSDEVDDTKLYRRYSFTDNEEVAAMPGPGGMMGGGPMGTSGGSGMSAPPDGMMTPGGPGMMGPQKGRGNRGRR